MSKINAQALVPNLFDIPVAAATHTGSQDHRITVCHLVAEALKNTPIDRWAVAAEMSRLSGREVSKHMLDGYTSEAREEFNIPAYLVPSFEVATDSLGFTRWLSEIRGGRHLVGRETLNAELGRLERQRDETARRIRELRHVMGERE